MFQNKPENTSFFKKSNIKFNSNLYLYLIRKPNHIPGLFIQGHLLLCRYLCLDFLLDRLHVLGILGIDGFSIADIQQRVANEFGLRVDDINGRRRTAAIAHPRQVAMFLARRHTSSSLQDIGAAFGGRDHGTVLHATKTIEQKLAKITKFVAVGFFVIALGVSVAFMFMY